MKNSIPICFYPMRKMILDDDQSFSSSIALKLRGNSFISFNSPREALNFLSNEYQPILKKSDLTERYFQLADSDAQYAIKININNLGNLVSSFSKQDINVLFVDYHMPEMTGIEFLNEIKDFPIKKALITGEQDYKIAIDAFNSGLVDSYLRKDDLDFPNEIGKISSKLEWEYFCDLSSFILEFPEFDYLKNHAVVSAFKKHLFENGVESFYLHHAQGDFLTINSSSEKKYILIRSKLFLSKLSQIAADDGASEDTIKKLESGSSIPFFGLKEYWEVPAVEWDKYLHPCNKISGDGNMMWATVSEKSE